MHKSSLLNVLLVLHITLCNTIRVPVDWTEKSEVNNNEPIVRSNTNEEIYKKPEHLPYFRYTAEKPQFAIDIAASHDVKSPENHFKSYPVRPYTEIEKPELGKHLMLDEKKESFHPYQHYISANKDDVSHVTPVSTYYHIYHPYKAEEPALQEIYKDPVLDKIRNDLRDSKDRLQQYENNAGLSEVTKDKYLESPEYTEYKYQPIKSKRSQFEIHKPLRQPLYYRPQTKNIFREGIVFKRKLRDPRNQNYAKISPIHYQPIKNHLIMLKQQQAKKFDDEHNEYPQLPIKESYAKKPEGYDIYEKGRDRYLNLKNNVDMYINKAVLENRPHASEKLELSPNHDGNLLTHNLSQKDEFVPIKNYAQVRKTETIKHLPRIAAYRDADSLDEIQNAPRLRQAIKSTKAQVVYSEEGYEDSAYDHAGEQKHASDIEGHGGFLKEKELSHGKYKTPSVAASHNDAGGSTHKNQVVHGKKWKNDYRDTKNETNIEDFSEEHKHNDSHSDTNYTSNTETPKKRYEKDENDGSAYDIDHDHVLVKREFDVPKIILNSTFLTGDQTTTLETIQQKKNNSEQDNMSKYPYYLKKSLKLNNDSPLRYAENLKFIPKKTLGGTEFYDSRKGIICPTIEEDIDPIPEKIKKGGNPDDNISDKDSEFDQLKNKQRLGGLGDKIDCLKYKFFGENPLDSPFFKEDIIASPIPIINSSILRTKRATPFMYEPYKIIKESQVIDSKKTTTTNNISPLIKQLQSSRVVDRVTANQNKDQVVKRNTNTKYYKNIGKVDRQSQDKNESNDFQEKDFYNISIDKRRGEPRYELKHQNHRNHYNPVKNITSISLDEYREHSDFIDIPSHSNSMPTFFNPKKKLNKSNHLLSLEETQNEAASNFINKIILTTTLKPTSTMILTNADDEPEEEYYGYDDDRKMHQEGKKNITTTTAIIPKRKRKHIRVLPTPKATLDVKETDSDKPVLQLKLRFRSSKKHPEYRKTHPILSNTKIDNSKIIENISPKVKEKKKNVSESTIVTDSRSYGEEDNNMREKDIDDLIGVQHDSDEYLPEYERQRSEVFNEPSDAKKIDESIFVESDEENYDEDDESDGDNSNDEEYEEDEDTEDDDKVDSSDRKRLTARELRNQTLPKTTEATATTTEILLQRDVIKPIVLKKRLEVHRELPVDKKSPNVTRFMQDIKEIEVIKTVPPITKQKSRKNLEALDLYKDENLAKDVNKLGGVEIFKENLDLTVGPKHGGNYRSIEEKYTSKDSSKKDEETSQSEYEKKNESKDLGNSSRRRSNIRNGKIELISTTERPISHLHGGNLKQSPRRGTNKNEKIIELTDNNEGRLQLHGGNLKSRRGKSNEINVRTVNFKNTDEVEGPDKVNRELSEKTTKYDPDVNGKAAEILNSYVQAVPILTSPPPFIVDPSKRRYFYVDV